MYVCKNNFVTPNKMIKQKKKIIYDYKQNKEGSNHLILLNDYINNNNIDDK